VTAVADDREQQLAWEERQRPRAGASAIVAAVFLLAGFLWWVTLLRDAPQAGYLESLARLGDGPIGELPSIQVEAMQYTVDNAVGFILSGLLRGLAPVALAYTVTFLAVATRARRPEFPRLAVYMTIVGAVLYFLGTAGAEIERTIAFNSFLDGPRTVDDAREVISSTTVTIALLAYVGQFVTAAGLLLVSLNAMRAGLLTRFLGILGVVAGVVSVFPQLMPVPLVQAFWLVALGLLLLRRGTLPPAWRSGKAEPWPSAKEGAERRRAAEERRQGIVREPEPKPKPKPKPAAKPHASSKKRKRKRRD
jgi:hypothetical protein